MATAKCDICTNPDRVDIESAILAGQPITSVAKFYNLNRAKLQHHIEICSSYLLSLDEFDNLVATEICSTQPVTERTFPGSIQRQLKLKEADLLAASAQEYMITLKNIGRKINHYVDNSDDAEGLANQQRFLRKPIMDAYVMIGSEIRQTVRTLAELQKLLDNKEPETPYSGLQALAGAIARSANN